MFENILARGKRKAVEGSASSGFSLTGENKMAVAVVAIIIILAVYMFLQPKVPGAGTTTTTLAGPQIASSSEAGETISDLSESAAAASSVLKDIDNSIG